MDMLRKMMRKQNTQANRHVGQIKRPDEMFIQDTDPSVNQMFLGVRTLVVELFGVLKSQKTTRIIFLLQEQYGELHERESRELMGEAWRKASLSRTILEQT